MRKKNNRLNLCCGVLGSNLSWSKWFSAGFNLNDKPQYPVYSQPVLNPWKTHENPCGPVKFPCDFHGLAWISTDGKLFFCIAFGKPRSIPRQLQTCDHAILCRILKGGDQWKHWEFEYTVFFPNTQCISLVPKNSSGFGDQGRFIFWFYSYTFLYAHQHAV